MEGNLRLIDDVTRRIEENDLSGELALPRKNFCGPLMGAKYAISRLINLRSYRVSMQ